MPGWSGHCNHLVVQSVYSTLWGTLWRLHPPAAAVSHRDDNTTWTPRSTEVRLSQIFFCFRCPIGINQSCYVSNTHFWVCKKDLNYPLKAFGLVLTNLKSCLRVKGISIALSTRVLTSTWQVCAHVCVLPLYEWLKQRAMALVEQQQVGGQTEVAAQCLPLTRTCNCNTHTHLNILFMSTLIQAYRGHKHKTHTHLLQALNKFQ